jgi:hypothetical protein
MFDEGIHGMGGLAEAHAPQAAVGPTFQAILAKQFQALCDTDDRSSDLGSGHLLPGFLNPPLRHLPHEGLPENLVAFRFLAKADPRSSSATNKHCPIGSGTGPVLS